MEIPVIDYQASGVSQAVASALKDVGCIILANHPINTDLMTDDYKLWNKFFHSQEKFAFNYHTDRHDGFVSMAQSEIAKDYSVKDIKEFYHFYPEGRCPCYLQSSSLAVFHSLSNLARVLLTWIEQHLPEEISRQLSMPLANMVRHSPQTLLRVTHFPSLTGHEELGAMPAAPHEDINLLTLYPAPVMEGVEIKDNKGRWLSVPANPGWIVVHVGDMLQECTQFYYPATSQRVIRSMALTARQSMLLTQLFIHPRDEVRLSDRYTAGEYRRERFVEIGLGSVAKGKLPRQTKWQSFVPELLTT